MEVFQWGAFVVCKLICAIRLPHALLSTFHTIINT
jgi:hypothetical protein